MDSFRDVVKAPEHALVRDVFADQLLAQHVGVPPSIQQQYEYRLRVTPDQLGLSGEAFGDVDALIIEKGVAQRGSACEFKRVKVTPSSFRTGRLNKLTALAKAGHQANALHAAGFAHVWLTVIIVADTRVLTNGSGYGMVPVSLIDQVNEAIPLSRMAADIGITVCMINQVSDRPANFRGTSGGSLLRHATERAQSGPLTTAIADLFSRAS